MQQGLEALAFKDLEFWWEEKAKRDVRCQLRRETKQGKRVLEKAALDIVSR